MQPIRAIQENILQYDILINLANLTQVFLHSVKRSPGLSSLLQLVLLVQRKLFYLGRVSRKRNTYHSPSGILL